MRKTLLITLVSVSVFFAATSLLLFRKLLAQDAAAQAPSVQCTTMEKEFPAAPEPALAAASRLPPVKRIDSLEKTPATTGDGQRSTRMSFRLAREARYPNLLSWVPLRPEVADRLIQLDAEQSLDLLGPDLFQQWTEYVQSGGFRQPVEELRDTLTGADALREDQVRAILAALALEGVRFAEESDAAVVPDPDKDKAGFEDWEVERTRRTNEGARAAAAPYLSAEQLRIFDEMLRRKVTDGRAVDLSAGI